MEEKRKSEQLISDLIKKRKQENDAFTKLLSAIGNKMVTHEIPKNQKKNKPCL